MSFPVWIPFVNEWWTFLSFLGLIITCIIFSNFTLNKRWLSPEQNRRLIHLLIGIMISYSPMVFIANTKPAILSAIFIILNLIAHKNSHLKGIHSQDRITYGTIYFPIGYLIIIIAFWDYSPFIILSLSILTFSDPLASFIGSSVKSPIKFKIWYDTKTVQGTFAFFSSAFIITFFGAQILFDYKYIQIIGLALFTALGSTIAEITSNKGTDNITIPIVSILFMIAFSDQFYLSDDSKIILGLELPLILFIISILLFVSYELKVLSKSGFFGALIMGVIITMIGSFSHLLFMAIFFIFSSILGKIFKIYSFYKSTDLKRNIIQVYANGGIALILCIHEYFNPNPLTKYFFFASIAAAMSDTWGSEFGKISKNRPISITSFKPVPHGYSGGITRIGTLGSLLGACIIGFFVWYTNPNISHFIIYGIILCGFFSALFDSILGDLIQAKYETKKGDIVETFEKESILISGNHYINNDMVNLISTVFAPCMMYILLLFFSW